MLWTTCTQKIIINRYKRLKKLGYELNILFLKAYKATGYEELLQARAAFKAKFQK